MRTSLILSSPPYSALWWVTPHGGRPRPVFRRQPTASHAAYYRPNRPTLAGTVAVYRPSLGVVRWFWSNVRRCVAIKSDAAKAFSCFSGRRGGFWTTLVVDVAGLFQNNSGTLSLFTVGVWDGLDVARAMWSGLRDSSSSCYWSLLAPHTCVLRVPTIASTFHPVKSSKDWTVSSRILQEVDCQLIV